MQKKDFTHLLASEEIQNNSTDVLFRDLCALNVNINENVSCSQDFKLLCFCFRCRLKDICLLIFFLSINGVGFGLVSYQPEQVHLSYGGKYLHLNRAILLRKMGFSTHF